MEKATVVNTDDLVDLPPGFRFHPTDEEIITHYLTEKVKNSNFNACAIGEVDLNKCEPWDLPERAKMGEKEWYFFCQRDRKYPTGMRTNRATEAGYWKATGKDKEIFRGKNCLVGMKKTLVFYKGRAPKGEKSNWVMHEYRLEGKFSYYSLPRGSKDEWVVCRVFHKSQGLKKTSIHDLLPSNSYLPPLMEPPYNIMPGSSSYNNDGESGHQFNPVTSSISSDANYLPQFSTTMTNQSQNFFHQQPPQSIGFQIPTNNYHHQVQVTNPLYNFQTTPNMGYLQGFQGAGFDASDSSLLKALASNNEASRELLEKQCKVEQFSSNNQSMVSLSQDTGISTDMNTTAEISSKQEIASENNHLYEALEGPSIGMGDLDQLWGY